MLSSDASGYARRRRPSDRLIFAIALSVAAFVGRVTFSAADAGKRAAAATDVDTEHLFSFTDIRGVGERELESARHSFRQSTGFFDGVVSLRGIADELKRRGVPTATGRSEWQAVQISRVLKRLAAVRPRQRRFRAPSVSPV